MAGGEPAGAEELLAGGMLGAQPFCFSRERMYLVYPNLSICQLALELFRLLHLDLHQ